MGNEILMQAFIRNLSAQEVSLVTSNTLMATGRVDMARLGPDFGDDFAQEAPISTEASQ